MITGGFYDRTVSPTRCGESHRGFSCLLPGDFTWVELEKRSKSGALAGASIRLPCCQDAGEKKKVKLCERLCWDRTVPGCSHSLTSKHSYKPFSSCHTIAPPPLINDPGSGAFPAHGATHYIKHFLI